MAFLQGHGECASAGIVLRGRSAILHQFVCPGVFYKDSAGNPALPAAPPLLVGFPSLAILIECGQCPPLCAPHHPLLADGEVSQKTETQYLSHPPLSSGLVWMLLERLTLP